MKLLLEDYEYKKAQFDAGMEAIRRQGSADTDWRGCGLWKPMSGNRKNDFGHRYRG